MSLFGASWLFLITVVGAALAPFDAFDYDCWHVPTPLVDWDVLRQKKLIPPLEQDVYSDLTNIVQNVDIARQECPIGTAVALIVVTHGVPRWMDVVDKELGFLLDNFALLPLWGTTWPLWKVLCALMPEGQNNCEDGITVAGYPMELILTKIKTFVAFAENEGLKAAKFLKEFDPLIYGIMKDPRDYGTSFVHQCPVAAMSVSVVASLLALMAQPPIVEMFAKVFCLLHSLTGYRLRPFDLALGDAEALAPIRAYAKARPHVYLTAIGGELMSPYLPAFMRQARKVGIRHFIYNCLDGECMKLCQQEREEELCVDGGLGHVVFQKHQLIPELLDAGAGVFWIDFDVYLYKDPINLIPDDDTDMFVTEHWNAKCLNNGIFYVRSNERTTAWFLEFLRWQYEFVFGDNQNGFDAFLAHSARESFMPELPKVTYKLLDVENQVISAEGWYGDYDNITLLHFWSSDYLMRDGTMEPKPDSLKKSHLFRIFFNGTDVERREVIDILRYPRPTDRNACSVTTLGINELLNEHAPGVESMLPDFKALERQRTEAMEVRKQRLAEEERKRDLEDLNTSFVEVENETWKT
eukprot:GEMP01030783.1.p1 GENE.GEMP01030783.1~~GEMP01030783.1.p1  ORF type:complete len:581 (+),score=128.34 GEMP01030783.1:153-1895(+)